MPDRKEMSDKKQPKNYWNYRLLRMKCEDYDYFYISEVHYKDGEPVAYKPHASNHVIGSDEGNPHKSLRWTLNKMKEALSKDILDTENWPNIYER